nr:hypothetical protein [Tanacetum cinerariifolium]
NQLGKTIKSLRSDRGGEYMSQEFLDHLNDYGIIAHRTPPYTPQHNGYPKETMGYYFYYSPENKVLVAQNAEFLENNTSLNHKEEDLEIDEPQSDIVPICRSTRTRHAPDRMRLYIDAEEHELGDLGEPANYKASLLDPESKKWLYAMNVEMQSMKDNEVWVLVELPPNGKTVGIGSIMYAVRCTRPDVAFAQNITSRFQKNPGDIHWTTVKNILKYLRNTKDMFLVYEGEQKRELMTGYVFVLNGGVVDWKSAKQNIFATTYAEAKYIAAFDASKEAVWVRKFISGLSVVLTIEKPISMYCDNTGAIAIANEFGITKDDNLADPFTKSLAFPKQSEPTKNIGMLPASSLM